MQLMLAAMVSLLLQAPVQPAAPPIAGHWTGTIRALSGMVNVRLTLVRGDDGLFMGHLEYLDSPIPEMPTRIDRVETSGSAVRIAFDSVRARFEGSLAADGNMLSGSWHDDVGPLPLTLKKSTPPPPTPPATSLDVPLHIRTPVAPMPFAGGARQHFAYELHITNVGQAAARMQKLEVLADGATLASYDGAALHALLSWPAQPATTDARTFAPWQLRVAWMWISQPRTAALPRELRHRLTVDGRTTTTEPIAMSTAPTVVIGPPLKGGVWAAVQGPGPDSGHRVSIMTIAGRFRIPQRFGVDWVRIGSGGNQSYGAEVIAVADGVVADAVDGIPDNAPDSKAPAVPITLETVGGNVVILEIAPDRYVFYAHLQPGLLVKKGDRVRRGQVLGRIGNSGDSKAAHLHFHVMDAPFFGEGVPFVIDSFEALAGPNTGARVNVAPMNRARVRFPE